MKLQEDINLFKERKIKARDLFSIEEITKSVAYNFIKQYHYLGEAKFFAVKCYGLFYEKELVGCATFSYPQGVSALKGWFGLNNDTNNIFELSRLCVLPILNNSNATSFLLSGSIKKMNAINNKIKSDLHSIGETMRDDDYFCRAIITLADSSRHVGSIYQVCNFKYYGLTDQKTDFFEYTGGGIS